MNTPLVVPNNNRYWNGFLTFNGFHFSYQLEEYFNKNYSASVKRDWLIGSQISIWTITFDSIEDKVRFQLEWL